MSHSLDPEKNLSGDHLDEQRLTSDFPMNFAELRFWQLLFFGLCAILLLRAAVCRCRPQWVQTYDKLSLMALGFMLLMAVSLVTFIVYLAVLLCTYFGLAWIIRYHRQHARRYLWLLIPLLLGPLFYYKYSDFVVNKVLGFDHDFFRHVLIPVGISFYTFQKIAFVVDTLVAGKPLPRFTDFLNFAGFFPQIVAGPIERRSNLLPQMEGFGFRWLPASINEGAAWLALGFFFKCALADNLATYFDASSADNAYRIWLANLLFGLRIYFDFAGYSLIALGIARCLGVRLTLNFASPYCAPNVAEFWRRWHITLSQWFRDYVYIPLGGARTPFWGLTLIVVFLVSGVWHGAGWGFLLWGALHGTYLVAFRLTPGWKIPPAVGWGLTMVAVFAAWLFFYESRTALLLEKWRALFTPSAYSLDALRAATGPYVGSHGAVLTGLLVLAVGTLALEWFSLRFKNDAYHYLRKPFAVCLLVFLTILLAPGHNNAFIYFAF